MVKAAIFGCQGLSLTKAEKAFFSDVRPAGMILFKRNVDTPDQVRALTQELRDVIGFEHLMILIDQEGGRVARLKPPHWMAYPPALSYGLIADTPAEQRELIRLGARLMAHDLAELGINVDCAPVLDVPQPGAHDIIGDRAFGSGRDVVATMGRAVCEGLLAGGVLPIIKHIPGHGRALADSHLELPVVSAPLEALEQTDFYPFRVNSDMPIAMTAHVTYEALDARYCATQSRKVIAYMREALGFDGLILCDDLGMHALKGEMGRRAHLSLKAGCDLVMLCNGTIAQMAEVAEVTPKLKGIVDKRFRRAFARLPLEVEPLDVAVARARLERALARRPEVLMARADPTAYEPVLGDLGAGGAK